MKKLFSKVDNWLWTKVRKIKRLIRYVPTIWNSEDFDYRYALELFEMKLEDIATFMESDKAWSAESKQDAKRIRLVLRLMRKVYDEDYAIEYFAQLENLYGQGVTEFDFTEDQDEESPIYKLRYQYENLPNAEEIREVQSRLFWESNRKQEKAHRLLWKLIEHNIRRWWD